jgi:hypothetical protein
MVSYFLHCLIKISQEVFAYRRSSAILTRCDLAQTTPRVAHDPPHAVFPTYIESSRRASPLAFFSLDGQKRVDLAEVPPQCIAKVDFCVSLRRRRSRDRLAGTLCDGIRERRVIPHQIALRQDRLRTQVEREATERSRPELCDGAKQMVRFRHHK